MKLKTKIARWLRKLADRLDPKLRYDGPMIPQTLSTSTHKIKTIKTRQSYPYHMVENCPYFGKVLNKDIARALADAAMKENCIAVSKVSGNGALEFEGRIMVVEPYYFDMNTKEKWHEYKF